MGQFGHQHVEDDAMHNYTHDLSMFDHLVLSIITLWKVTHFHTCKITCPTITSNVGGVICYMYT